jgi:RES domain-containing protein
LEVDSTSVSGAWFRHIPAGGDVYYQPPDAPDNRWQRGAVVEALYFGDSEQTVWAEWYRSLAEAGLPPRQGLPRDLWRWEISLPNVADLRTHECLKRVALPDMWPSRLQWPVFQQVGERLHHEGWPALISTSAARPEGEILCVFRTARVVPGTHPISPPRTVTEPPVPPMGMRT